MHKALLVLALGVLAPAAPAEAATCRFDPVAHALYVSVGVDSASIVQSSGQIELFDSAGPQACMDGDGTVAASVTNTDAVHVVADGGVSIVPASGPFAPGFTPETDGASE